MTLETSKAYRRRFCADPVYLEIFKGVGIDIGGGSDPLQAKWFPEVSSVRNFDLKDGDAQYITRYVQNQFDFVYSSNCLEHMELPSLALQEWWSLVRPGGYMVIIVPDEDIYEQNPFPSRWNGGHRWFFTVHKEFLQHRTLSLVKLWREILDARLVHVRMADSGYNYRHVGIDQTISPDGAEAFIEMVLRKK
jgi:predicted SAM-dependent methyltransferase